MFVFVGSNGTKVTSFELERSTGALTKKGEVEAGSQPSYVAVSPDKKYLYAVLEGGSTSQVVAYTIDPETAQLTKINQADTKGQGSPHLAVHPSGKWIVAAHYGGGQISVLPVAANGGVSEATTVTKGPSDNCQNAHQAVFASQGKYLFVPCLGSSYTIQFNFNAESGEITPNSTPTVQSPSPRHLAFDPAEQHAYVLSEYESKITWFAYDAATGVLSNPQAIDSFDDQAGSSAHIVVHPSGKWLYASNRQENSLGLFALDASGVPSPVAFETAMINKPRDFTVDASGAYLILANQEGDQSLLVYQITAADGRLTRVQTVPVGGNPTCAVTLTPP